MNVIMLALVAMALIGYSLGQRTPTPMPATYYPPLTRPRVIIKDDIPRIQAGKA